MYIKEKDVEEFCDRISPEVILKAIDIKILYFAYVGVYNKYAT